MNRNEYNILKVLNSQGQPVFFRDLSKKSAVSIGGVQQVLKDYSEFIDKKIEGRNTYYFFKDTLDVFYLKKIFELEKAKVFIKENPRFRELFKFFIINDIYCIIFGSYAKEKFSKNSDIDILILSTKKVPEHISPVKLHEVHLTKSQFESALKKKESLIKEIRDNHIIINGVDYFMNLLRRTN